MQKSRMRIAIVLIGAAIVLNLIILIRGEESPGWPLLAALSLGAAGVALLSQRRPWQ